MSEQKGLDTGVGEGVSCRRDEDLIKVVRMGKREQIGSLERVYRVGRPLRACEF